MSGFIEGENRGQSTLFPERFDDYVGENSPVRVIDVFIDGLGVSGLGFKTDASDTGRMRAHKPLLRSWPGIGMVECVLACSAIVLLFVSEQAEAIDFRVGPVEGIFDTTLSYGAIYRTKNPEDDLVAAGNGGNAADANADDGTLNYDTGIVSNMVAFNTELTFKWGAVGGFVKTIGYYDWEVKDDDREHRDFSSRTLDTIGSNVEVRDAYLTGRFGWGGLPWQVRVGKQVINWGETTFVRDGVDTISPFDAVAAFQPARSRRDTRVPHGMVWAAANVTETFAVEAFYQYDWEGVALPAAGSYFSTNDLTGTGDFRFAQLSGNEFSDLGTDLDVALGLPVGTLGFDPQFLQIPERFRDTPRNSGQFGAGILAITQGGNALKFGLHYIRYHSRLPLIGGVTADQAGVDATSDARVADTEAALAPVYESAGLSSSESQVVSMGAAGSLTLSEYANSAGYFSEYPEDISMWAMTFNTATLRTGTLVGVEISHHRNFPFQLALGDVFNAILSPIQFDNGFAMGALGGFAASSRISGYKRLDRSQLAVSATQLLGPRFGASQSLLAIDAAFIHVHDFPGRDEPALQAPGGGDASSWGYRLLAQLEYSSVLGGLNILPRIAFVHDAKGFTPAPVSAFREDRKVFSIGVRANYINRWFGDLSYTTFFGGGNSNNLSDRDFIRFQVGYGF
ncbi:MAG: DUF1302 family protein [Gammaproteobacteria bacterium]|nr:DUF1302 family protein [Gammaproteobacteria bacterium]